MKTFIPRTRRRAQQLSLFWATVGFCSLSSASEYTLEQAVYKAQTNDPWLDGSRHKEAQLKALGTSAGALPDPTINVGVANLPIDNVDFNETPMTQFKMGVQQVFPRGKTRSLKKQKLEKLSRVETHARSDRKAFVAMTVSHLWLEVYRNQKTIDLIEGDRHLFEHLVDVAQSSYSTAFGRTRQQDLIRAQLELTGLEDRLNRLYQQRDMNLAHLGEWLSDAQIHLSDKPEPIQEIPLAYKGFIENAATEPYGRSLNTALTRHPRVQGIDQQIRAMDSGIALAQQSYKPQWGINASYGYRGRDPMGIDRSDFFSLGLSFDVPLFNKNRQDKSVQAATAEKEGIKTERALLLRQLRANFDSVKAQYVRLLERKKLYRERFLKEIREQAEASLSAYTNDDGDFAEVVRARIAELNAQIETLTIDIDIKKSRAQIHYLLAGVATSTPKEKSLDYE